MFFRALLTSTRAVRKSCRSISKGTEITQNYNSICRLKVLHQKTSISCEYASQENIFYFHLKNIKFLRFQN